MQDEKSDSLSSSAILEMTADVVAAYAGNNSVPAVELTKAINAVHASLTSLNDDGGAPAEPPKPAVSIRRSVRPDYIVCLEDGKKLKMLKRHLRTTYGMTPDEYRARWGLASDYPMVAPNYAKQRSEFAKKIGLGRKPRKKTRKRAKK
jgi:predicted transcriptional regulator